MDGTAGTKHTAENVFDATGATLGLARHDAGGRFRRRHRRSTTPLGCCTAYTTRMPPWCPDDQECRLCPRRFRRPLVDRRHPNEHAPARLPLSCPRLRREWRDIDNANDSSFGEFDIATRISSFAGWINSVISVRPVEFLVNADDAALAERHYPAMIAAIDNQTGKSIPLLGGHGLDGRFRHHLDQLRPGRCGQRLRGGRERPKRRLRTALQRRLRRLAGPGPSAPKSQWSPNADHRHPEPTGRRVYNRRRPGVSRPHYQPPGAGRRLRVPGRSQPGQRRLPGQPDRGGQPAKRPRGDGCRRRFHRRLGKFPDPGKPVPYDIYTRRYARTSLVQYATIPNTLLLAGTNPVYGANGEIGGEVPVNSTRTGDQRYPGVAMDNTGDAVVVWSGFGNQSGQADSSGVYYQRFAQATDSAGPSVGEVWNSTTANGNTLTDRVTDSAVLDSTPAYFVLTFGEALSTAGGAGGTGSVLNLNNWQLTLNGTVVNGGIASVQYLDRAASPGDKYEVVVTFDGDPTKAGNQPLGGGRYVLTLKDSVQDIFGNKLDGDYNGNPGGNFNRTFTVSARQHDGTGSTAARQLHAARQSHRLRHRRQHLCDRPDGQPAGRGHRSQRRLRRGLVGDGLDRPLRHRGAAVQQVRPAVRIGVPGQHQYPRHEDDSDCQPQPGRRHGRLRRLRGRLGGPGRRRQFRRLRPNLRQGRQCLRRRNSS